MFDQDWTLRDAAARQVEIIVDAYVHLDPGTQGRFGNLPVAEMTGMRVHLAHIYWQTDYGIVWETITSDIPGIVQTATSEHQPPGHGPTVYDEDTSIPRWQSAASGGSAAAPNPWGGLSPPDRPSRRAPGGSPSGRVPATDTGRGVLARLFRRTGSVPSGFCGRPTSDGTPCRQRRPAKVGDSCAAGHKRVA